MPLACMGQAFTLMNKDKLYVVTVDSFIEYDVVYENKKTRTYKVDLKEYIDFNSEDQAEEYTKKMRKTPGVRWAVCEEVIH